jgi:hypothetical protein
MVTTLNDGKSEAYGTLQAGSGGPGTGKEPARGFMTGNSGNPRGLQEKTDRGKRMHEGAYLRLKGG